MNDSLELALTIGNGTDTMVAEGLWCYLDRYDDEWAVDSLRLAGYLVATDYYDTLEAALAAVDAELVLGGVKLLYGQSLDGTEHEGGLVAALDSVTYLRLRRRYLFWSEMAERCEVPPHILNEGVIARAAVIHWQEHYGEAVGVGDLVDTVQMLTGYDHRFWAIHIVLNAIDAGAIYTKPEHDANGFDWSAATGHRCWLTDGWLQTHDS